MKIQISLEWIFLLERGMIFFKLLWSMKYTCNIGAKMRGMVLRRLP